MEITIPVLAERFLATKQTEGLSGNTIRWYRMILTHFDRFLKDNRLQALSIDHAREFIAHLQARDTRFEKHPTSKPKEGGLSPHTVAGYVRGIKAFSSWLNEEGYTGSNLFLRLKRPKVPQKMVEVLTDEEIQRMVACINPNTFLGARLLAIVLLLLDTGIRASELCGLTLDNLDLRDGEAKVNGKGDKERVVPFASTTRLALMRWTQTFRQESTHDEVFLTTDGNPLTYNSLKLIVQRLADKSGIPRLHLHLFRHTFAVKYLMNGGDLMTLKRILGHTTLQVTQMYLHLVNPQIKQAHLKFSPVDKLGIKIGRRR